MVLMALAAFAQLIYLLRSPADGMIVITITGFGALGALLLGVTPPP